MSIAHLLKLPSHFFVVLAFTGSLTSSPEPVSDMFPSQISCFCFMVVRFFATNDKGLRGVQKYQGIRYLMHIDRSVKVHLD